MQLSRQDLFGRNPIIKKSLSKADQKKIEKRKKMIFVSVSTLLILVPIMLYAVTTLAR